MDPRPLVKEVTDRLEAGDNPIQISIDIWTKKLHAVESGDLKIPLSVKTCALCMATNSYVMRCEVCPYFKYYGDVCFGEGRPYDKLDSEMRGEPDQQLLIKYTRQMIAELVELLTVQKGE